MNKNHLYVLLFLSIFSVPVYGLTCSCQCGPSSYTPSASCSTASQCAQTCYWGYPACIKGYTYGCCGNLGCAWYGGDEVYDESGTCICQCSSSSGGSTSEQGRANSSLCATSTCQSACRYLYSSTCGTYTNAAYCSTAINHHQTSIFVLIFFIVGTVYFLYMF